MWYTPCIMVRAFIIFNYLYTHACQCMWMNKGKKCFYYDMDEYMILCIGEIIVSELIYTCIFCRATCDAACVAANWSIYIYLYLMSYIIFNILLYMYRRYRSVSFRIDVYSWCFVQIWFSWIKNNFQYLLLTYNRALHMQCVLFK